MASRLMAERGYAGTSLSALMQATGLPKSAIYHHFNSKGGLLSAVMARGAHRFFGGMRKAHAEPPDGGTPRERLLWYLERTADVFAERPEFLRLHMLLILSSEAAESEVADVIGQIRDEGRAYMNEMIRSSFAPAGPDAARRVADRLDYFGIAGFDGAFIASQADPARTVMAQMAELAEALAALGDTVLAESRP